MNPANESPHSATGLERPWADARLARTLTIAALMLAAAGLGLRWIAGTNTDLPPLKALTRDAANVYLPALRGGATAWTTVFQTHAPAANAWPLTWLALNGQWDARLLSVANLALQVLVLGVLFAMLARSVGSRVLAALGVGALAILVLAPIAPRPVATAGWSSGLLALSLLHLLFMTGPREPRWRFWAGLACGWLNVVMATAGIASALALLGWSGLAAVRDRPAWRIRRSTLIANGGLVGFGAILAACRAAGPDANASFFHSLHTALPWPLEQLAWTPVLWAPAIVCVFRWMRSPAGRRDLSELALLVLWLVIQIVALAALPIGAADVAGELLMAGIIVNAACLVALPAEGWQWPTRNLALVSLWCLFVANALLHPSALRVPPAAGPEVEAPVTAALRRTVFASDAGALRQTGELNDSEVRELLRVLEHPEIRRILPGSIRPPLPLEPENGIDTAAFQNDAAPSIPGRGDLPAFSSGSEAGPGTTGEFVSKPLESKSAFLQIRVRGELRPPATSLVLRTADGVEIAPLDGAFVANDRWKRVNFTTPAGPFRVVARDASPTAWFAFTAPQEMGRLSWLAGKLSRFWSWLFACGAALGLGLAGVALARARTHPGETVDPSQPRIVWPSVPWLVLVAYAVFFSHHVDPTAGPNDSGGYLNSAKILAHGHVTAEPRMIWGTTAGETDVTPYLPGTFRATPDGRMAPEYPVGFPLEIAAMAQLFPLETAVPAVILLQLVLGLVFTRQLARTLGLPDGWAWLAAGIVGLSPVYLFQALQPQSDGPALVWVTAAVYWAWSSRQKPWHAVLAGLATALAVMIRPSNLLCVVPVLICLTGAWRQLVWWALVGVPAALWQVWYNHELYGHWLTTGYGDIASNFELRFAPLTAKSYALWLPALFTPIVWLVFFGPFLRSVPLRVRLVLTSWVAVFMLFYAFYWCTYDNWYNMRFVLPAAPAMLILALFVLRWVSEHAGLTLFVRGPLWRTTMPSAALVAVLFGLLIADGAERRVLYWMEANHLHAYGAIWAREHFPKNAVVFAHHATGSLRYYTDLIVVRSDHEKAQSPRFFEEVAGTGRPIYALTYHWERHGFKWGNGLGDGYPDLPGAWEHLAVLRDGEIHAWAWHPPASTVGGTAK